MRSNPWIVIPFSFIVALFLTLLPLPLWFENARPEWIVLVLLFWIIMFPHRVNVGVAWMVGLLLDAFNDTLLGEHALALVVVAYVASTMSRRLRVSELWQQTISVLLLLLLYHMILFWIQGMIGQPVSASWFWLSAASSAILWPWIFILLKDSRRQFTMLHNIE
jgi:rod shape-determining protein MreD